MIAFLERIETDALPITPRQASAQGPTVADLTRGETLCIVIPFALAIKGPLRVL
jgi:hypothetical protein